jgi:DNA topoisomerase-1
VQSVAVRLVVEREQEIRAFKPEEYWTIDAHLLGGGPPVFLAELKRKEGEPVQIVNGEQAGAAYDDISKQKFVVDEVVKTKKTIKALPPFTTSLLQQAASTRLRFSTSRTMRVAQGLYEGVELGAEGSVGLITYMRTDSYNVSQQAIGEVRKLITAKYGAEFLPKEANVFAQRKGAQLAHEAIRPTYLDKSPDVVASFLNAEQLKLYQLIWDRFVASQMAPAQYDLTDARIHAGKWQFSARGRRLVFAGHTLVTKSDDAEAAPELPALDQGQELKLEKLDKTQHFTQPPPRYSEASLVKALEKKGIGRPSTYATIMTTIQARGYVRLEARAFHATQLGETVTGLLVEHFPHLMDVEFTAGLEDRLDQIEEAKADWQRTLGDFYEDFEKDLEKAGTAMRDFKKDPIKSDAPACEKCGSPMIVKLHPRGSFLACSAYPKCENTRSLDKQGQVREPPVETNHLCPKCQSKMVLRTGRTGKFLACSAYPKCKSTMSVDDKGEPIVPKPSGEVCDKCGGQMLIRNSRRGPFLGCENYPKCKNPKPLPKHLEHLLPKPEPSGVKCVACGKEMLIRLGRFGKYLACSGYPECKERAKLPKPPEPGEGGDADDKVGADVGRDPAGSDEPGE